MYHRPGQPAALSSTVFRSVSFLSSCLLRLASYLRDRPTYLSARLNLSQPSVAPSKKNNDRGAILWDHPESIDRTYIFLFLCRQIFVWNNSIGFLLSGETWEENLVYKFFFIWKKSRNFYGILFFGEFGEFFKQIFLLIILLLYYQLIIN